MFQKNVCLIAGLVMMSQLLTGAAGAADPSLVGWWKLDDGSGTTATDASPNAAHGTLMGGTEWVAGRIDGAVHRWGQGLGDNEAAAAEGSDKTDRSEKLNYQIQ